MTIVPAIRDQEPRLLDILVESFDRDPIVNWMVLQDERRKERLRAFFQMWLRLRSYEAGEVLTTPQAEGVFLWLPSQKVQASWREQLAQTLTFLKFCGLRNSRRVLSLFDVLAKEHPPEPHIYVQILGVDPRCRGKGIATDLFNEVIDMAERRGLPCYGETSVELNLDIWGRFGLCPFGEINFQSAPRLWKLRRDPGWGRKTKRR
jgi:ribosomal protein S18 acetylase RimI-like enzyme